MYLGGAGGICINMLISTEGLGIPTTIPAFRSRFLGQEKERLMVQFRILKRKALRFEYKGEGQYNCDGGSHLYYSSYYIIITIMIIIIKVVVVVVVVVVVAAAAAAAIVVEAVINVWCYFVVLSGLF